MKTKIRLKRKILKAFGAKMKEFRQKCGISQEKLAFQIGVDRTYVGAIEQGKRSPSIYCIYMISNALGIEMKDFFDFDL